jgi:hypothetical protein
LDRPARPEESFFELGGSSLQLMELHAELVKTCGKTLPITKLFEYPSIRAFSAWLAGSIDGNAASAQARDRGTKQREAMARRRPSGVSER